MLAITHYQRLLDHLEPDVVHILVDGRIVDSGGPELAERLEREGYEAWRSRPPLDVAAVKKDFPILDREVHGGRLVYLDSANTSQKPRVVLDAIEPYYERSNANVHRGTYLIAEEATAALEGARAKVARFIGAAASREVVFTKNATEALNLVAKAWGRANLPAGDAVVLTELEHHANIVPWHQLHDELGIELRWIPVRSTATSTSPISTGWSTAPGSSPSPPCPTCSARCCRWSGW